MWERVNVVAVSGSGKTTFSRRLAALLHAPCVEMDALYWDANWTPASDAVFEARLAEALASERWVLDGNYSRTTPIKWARVTSVIWLDYPLRLALWRVVARTARRFVERRELWPGTGNRETLRMVFSRESIVLWTLRTHADKRRRYSADMRDPKWAHVRFVRLRSPAEAERFLRELR